MKIIYTALSVQFCKFMIENKVLREIKNKKQIANEKLQKEGSGLFLRKPCSFFLYLFIILRQHRY